jgi:peptidoglycan/LPS O-acetylase OafA/YrhL
VATTALARSDDPRWYRGGFTVAAVLGAALVAAAREGGGALVRLLSLPPLRALGKISYGVYLWHVPVLRKLQGAIPLPEPLGFVAAASLAIGIAWLSYRFVERPVLAWRDRARTPPYGGSTRA